MTTIDWATGVIMLVFAIGLLTITTAVVFGAVAVLRLLGRGALATARWWRRRGTPGAWRCDDCGGDIVVCACPPAVPSWARGEAL